MKQKINCRQTFLQNTALVRDQNIKAWKEERKNVKNRLRGNAWTIFRRLVCDYNKHFGNITREKNKQLPYVDHAGYLYTSPALIAYAEGKSMSNKTISRWLVRFMEEFKINKNFFILEYHQCSPRCIRLRLNTNFFVLVDELPQQSKPDKPPPNISNGHIELTKLAKKFNRKHHIH